MSASILSRKLIKISPWVSIEEKAVKFHEGGKTEIYHNLATSDYVAIVAQTPDGTTPIVRQYRPAVENYTWELPAGLLEKNEDIYDCCRRELLEETGLRVTSLEYLGPFLPDTGRLGNRQHAFFARTSAPDPDFQCEEGIEVAFLTLAEIQQKIRNFSFIHQLHIAVLYLCELKSVYRIAA